MNKGHRTKIMATLGPASSDETTVRRLIDTGVNAFRLNFSHGDHNSHRRNIEMITSIRDDYAHPIAILADLSGPKIRVGQIAGDTVRLEPGQHIAFDVTIDTSQMRDGMVHLPVSYAGFARDMVPGGILMLDDGNLSCRVLRATDSVAVCEVLTGGELLSRKGINYPGGSFDIPALTPKDRADLSFILTQPIDMVALSFVTSPDDIVDLRKLIEAAGKSLPIIAKMEKHEAVSAADEIIATSDGIMIARGDLGVEIPLEDVPLVQKRLVRLANAHGKPAITATQMLMSMISSPRPSRAEVADIATAILDGSDALLLTAETAMGQYPVAAVEIMARVASKVESAGIAATFSTNPAHESISNGISHSSVSLAREIDAAAILCPTSSGFTARMISRWRPDACIIAVTDDPATYRALAIQWGVAPYLMDNPRHFEQLLAQIVKLAHAKGYLSPGDRYVVTGGYPYGIGGSTNLVHAGVASGA